MTQTLSELKAGDPVATWIGHSYGTYIKAIVRTVTPKHIIVEGSDLKFKKDTGSSLGSSPIHIKVITPEIQQEWDKKECKVQIDDILLKYKNLPSKVVELLTQARDSMK
jgi:hypothetical protein